MKRRNFFKSLARAAAIIALAPQIAFRVKPELIGSMDLGTSSAFWYQTTRASACYDLEYKKAFVRAFFYGSPFPVSLMKSHG